MTTRRRALIAIVAAASLSVAAPAAGKHAQKRCSVGSHNHVQPAAVTSEVPEEISDNAPDADVGIGLGHGRVQVGAACSTGGGKHK